MDQRRYKWIMLMLLWLLYIAFGIVARSIFPLVTPILRDLSISYSQMGLILGSWQLTYILAAMMAGGALDKWGVRRSILAGALIIAVSALLRFFANGFFFMLVAVALFGAGGPMISIGGPKTISELFEGKSRAAAVGIYTTGPWVGGFLALSLTNSLIMPLAGHSWRMAFVLYGMMVLIVAAFWWVLSRDIQTDIERDNSPMMRVFHELIGIPAVRILLVMALFSFAVSHGFSSWLPNILEGKGLSPAAAGWAASLPLASGIPAVLIIPRAVSPVKRGSTIAWCALVTIINLILVMKATGFLLYAALMIFGFFAAPFMPLLLLILMDSHQIETRHMGAAGGMFFCVAEMGGFGGPLVMGILVDITGNFFAGALFLSSLCLAMFSMTFFLARAE